MVARCRPCPGPFGQAGVAHPGSTGLRPLSRQRESERGGELPLLGSRILPSRHQCVGEAYPLCVAIHL